VETHLGRIILIIIDLYSSNRFVDLFLGCQFGLHGFRRIFFQCINFHLSSRLGEANFSRSADIYFLVHELLKWRVKEIRRQQSHRRGE
jgi:hypothetical protein